MLIYSFWNGPGLSPIDYLWTVLKIQLCARKLTSLSSTKDAKKSGEISIENHTRWQQKIEEQCAKRHSVHVLILAPNSHLGASKTSVLEFSHGHKINSTALFLYVWR
ncbi:hypothetical protein ATANTOWER_019666 [Ataeniobius toweri]|uniref:Uncharacterized protein n=1 Tax=Ataeniobius toweri TaxID=208326 RepID=A0ABU7B125_9TELE|nr:hypothetical protein [Ataeniobius toweri]